MLASRVLPPYVHAEESFGDIDGVYLFPNEIPRIADVVPKRVKEFSTTRHLARECLRSLGVPEVSIPTMPTGAPSWPEGVVGSMTHCDDYRAAIAASADDCSALGLDAEPHEALESGVLELIASDEEISRLDDLAMRTPAIRWDKILFSAKESAFKAGLAISDCTFHIGELDPYESLTGRFLVTWRCPPALLHEERVLDGAYCVTNDFVLTAIVVPRTADRTPVSD